MNPEIEFWAIRSNPADIQPVLDRFEQEQHIHVRLRTLDWDNAWAELLKVALYKHGPDLAEIGTTWLGDLVTTNALYSFSDRDINQVGPAWTFLHSAWQSTRLAGEKEVWAIPWFTEARLLFFRRPWIDQAKLDVHTAFRTPDEFAHSLATLEGCGVPMPLVIPTGHTRAMLHNAAGFMWSSEGAFLSPDGKHVAFNSERARAGLIVYFSLGRYLAPAARRLGSLESDSCFANNPDAAVTLTGPWVLRAASPELQPQLDMSMPPVPSFVGGSHLVIWKHSKKIEQSLKLIRFLTDVKSQVEFSYQIGHLPAQLSALASAPFSTNPLWQVAAHALRTGRSLPASRSWGLIEDRLTNEFAEIWEQVFTDPDLDLDAVLKSRLDAVAEQIDPLLASSST